MSHEAELRKALRQAEPRCKVGVVGIHETARISVLPADEDLGRTAAQIQIAVGVTDVGKRAHELIAHAVGEGGGRGEAPCILREAVGVPLAEVHLGNAGLALARGRQSRAGSWPVPEPVLPSLSAYWVV